MQKNTIDFALFESTGAIDGMPAHRMGASPLGSALRIEERYNRSPYTMENWQTRVIRT